MQPTALHWTSTLGESICRIKGSKPPSLTIVSLLSALTARLPSAALAARCTSTSCELNKNRMGSRVSRETSRTSFSVISANARAADLCRSTLSEYERVDKARKGSPVKKLVSWRFSRYWSRSATASRSLSSKRGSYGWCAVEAARWVGWLAEVD